MLPGQHRVNNKWAPAVSTLGRWRRKIPEALEPTSIDKRLTTRNRLKLKARPNTGGVLRPVLACCDKCESTLVYMNTNVHTQERERDGGVAFFRAVPINGIVISNNNRVSNCL